jgi:YfiH family protein
MAKTRIGFTRRKKVNIQYFSCDAIEKIGGFEQGFTIRKGGISRKPYDSFNVGMHTDDDKQDVKKNIRSFEKVFGVRYVAAARQVHGDGVLIVRRQDSGVRSVKKIQNTEADAVLTDVTGVAASVSVADCVGTVIVDPVNRLAASVHSGWRGVANKIPAKTVALMIRNFKSGPEKLIAAVSPAIGPCCYAVGEDVYKLQKQMVFSNIFTKRNGKIYMNLWKGVFNLLVSAGMKKENIHICDMCTSCNPELFFSHRRDKGKTGRMLVFGIIK